MNLDILHNKELPVAFGTVLKYLRKTTGGHKKSLLPQPASTAAI